MENKQITINELYEVIRKIELELNKINEKLDKQKVAFEWEELKFVGDENLIAENWLSEEDEKAFSYLQ